MNPRKDLSPELRDLKGRLEGARGDRYWRTLEELADSEAFAEMIRDEFPEEATVWTDAVSRRRFLTLMGASLALAGLTGCSIRPAPTGKIVPYVKAPEEIIPGRPLFYATALTLAGCGVGLLVESHMGRPTKIEGNPDHPASLGATDALHQASILALYDPDRMQTVLHRGQTATWADAEASLRAGLAKLPKGGSGLRILSETIVSPTQARQVADLLRRFPEARWHQYEPLARVSAQRAARAGFGEPVAARYNFQSADRILSLDCDFLASGPGHLRHVHDFAGRRRVRTSVADAQQATMNRLYVVETGMTLTGAKADHRLALPCSAIEGVARAIATRLGLDVGGSSGPENWVAAVARDLEQHREKCLVLAGDRQPPAVHLLAHAVNARLGNVGKTIEYTDPIEARPVDPFESLRELAEDMDAGRVEVLLILGGNPVYSAPADLHFAERMEKVPLRAHLTLFPDETSRLCHWTLPETHFLEAWGDTRAYDGTASIVQPLIEPLYEGRSALEVIDSLLGSGTTGHELVRDHWRQEWQGRKQSAGDFEDFWQTALHDGIVADTRYPAQAISLKEDWKKHLVPWKETPAEEGKYELTFEADSSVHDGRFANNGWLQELPRPITRLTWDNAVLVSPATAKILGVGHGIPTHGGKHGGYHQPVVELRLGDRVVRGPVWIVPGHADGAVTVSLGYGRVGGTAGEVGFNAYPLRSTAQPWFAPGLVIQRTHATYPLACVQAHHLMENRDLVRAGTLAEYHRQPRSIVEKEPDPARKETHETRVPLTLYEPFEYPKRRWGMAIDVTACVGCAACVVACQAENNIPIVGKEQVAAGREMHWLRIDRYVGGPADEPEAVFFQPVPCMHCERAPCEYVCPVEATVHSAEGLNDMVYQRCVGTRFCSNNCPYKVRRFNFLAFADFDTPSRRPGYNPDVTVRSRGVMEKCSYCVQRIRAAERTAEKEERDVRDGEILTACQSACPAGAIVFGDIADPGSVVRQWKYGPLNYALLAYLNTEPRTTYLAALRNPNPELEA